MIRRLLFALTVASVSLAAPSVGRAQAFKVDKVDIHGEGGTDYVAAAGARTPQGAVPGARILRSITSQ